jgi:hypothetical protein
MRKIYLLLLTGIMFAAIANGQTNYFSKAAATDFTDVNSWGTSADGSGASPASITNADNYTIQNGSVMNLNAGNAAVRTLTINAGSLTIGSNTLTVAIAAQNNSTLALNTGSTLTVSGGTLNVNGNFLFNAGGKFNQSGGSVNVDGNNGGVSATSVASAVNIVDWNPTALADLTLTGGTFTIVDPHANATATDAFRFSTSAAGTLTASTAHTFQFGDGVSTDAGGSTAGFKLEPWVTTAGFKYGNVVINTATGTNRFVNVPGTFTPFIVGGNLTITSGELRTVTTEVRSSIHVAGNITNNGTLTVAGTTGGAGLILADAIYATSTALTVNPTTVAQTISGSGVFRNLTASPTANFSSLTINNTNASGVTFSNANSLLSGTNTGTVSATLTFTAGLINTGSNALILGISIGTNGTLTYTAGGFTGGSIFGRWYGAASTGTTITSGAVPAIGSGSYPFPSGANSRNFHINRPLTTGATGGIISVQYTDGAGVNTIAPVVDGAYSIDRQSLANWTVSTSGGFAAGTGTFTYGISGQGIFSITNGNSRVLKVATVVGTHQPGTTLPHAQRTAISAADFTGAFYIGFSSADIPITTAQSGPWEDINTWVGGVVPVCGNNVSILNGHTVTVNAAAANAGAVLINSGGALTVSGNTLTVGCTNNNNSLTNNGTLTVSGGNLIVNGNLAINNGSSFIHSSGTITMDGNAAGVAGNSVASGTPIFAIGFGTTYSTGTITLSGGTIIIVDPHAATASTHAVYASVTAAANVNAATAHTLQFGDGVSTDAGGNANGFGFDGFVGGGRVNFGNVTVNSAAGTNRNVTQLTGTNVINGNLTVTAGTFSQNGLITNVGGNISVATGAVMIASGTTIFASVAGTTTSAQTTAQSVSVSGTGAINNLAAAATANFASVTINNTSSTGVTFNSLNTATGQPANTSSVSGTLTFTAGRITTGAGNSMILGTSVPAAGTLTVTAGGFSSGSSYGRWSTAGGTGTAISAGADPTTTTSRYPFVNAAGVSRSAWIERVTPTAAGIYAMTYIDAATNSAVSIVDGAYTVETRFDGNWTVSTLGTTPAAATYKIAIVASGVYGAINGNSRVTLAAAPAGGTHQNGTATPGAQRIGLTLADLTAGALYIGIANADVPFVSVTNGAWETPATWNKNAVPVATDAVIIANSTTVTVSATAAAAVSATVNSGGTLTVSGSTLAITNTLTNNGTVNASGGTLTVTAASTTGITNGATTGVFNVNGGTVNVGITDNTFCNRTFTNNGTLTVSSGTLNIYGNFVDNLASTFNQSGGNINVDGNAAGVAANSVASGTVLVIFKPTAAANINLTGGTFTIVDPHANSTATNAFSMDASFTGQVAATASHTFRFGDGVSADAGGNAVGFQLAPWITTTGMKFGNVVVNGPTGTNRMVTSSGSFTPLLLAGDLTINSGGEFRQTGTAGTNPIGLGGNLAVNSGGILTTLGIMYVGGIDFATGTSFTLSTTTNAQTLTNAGTIQNLTATPTANFTNLQINNSNATGVTLNSPLSVSGTLTLSAGLVNTTTTNLLTLGTATLAGTLSGGSATTYIKGPFARTFPASRTATGTYTVATLYPVGKGASYLPIHIDPTTTAGGAVVLRGEAFTTNSGTLGVGVTTLSTNRWEALVTNGGANLSNSFIRLNDAAIAATNKIVQSTAAAGAYTGIPATSTFAAGTPNTLTTATSIPAGSYSGYFAYGDVSACAAPADQPTAFAVANLGATAFNGSFTAAASTPSNYLVVRYVSPATETTPVDFTTYIVGGTLGTGTVVSVSSATAFTQTGLLPGTTYLYYIYSYNNTACAGPVYRITSPLIGTVTTCATAVGAPGTPTSANITTTSFDVNWAASSTAGVTYELDIATNSTFTSFVTGYNALNVGSVLTFNANTNINPSTVYYVRVRAIDGSCYSLNTATLTVTTACAPVSVPYIEDFDAVTVPALPICTSIDNVNGSTTWTTVNANSHSGANNLSYHWDASQGGDDWFFTKPLNLTGGSSYRLTFWYAAESDFFPEAMEVKYGTANNAAGMTSAALFTDNSVDNEAYVQATIDFTPATTGTYYIGFHETSIADQFLMHLDDISVTVSPTCLPPTAVSVGTITQTSAFVSFTSPGGSFIVEYGAPGFTPGLANLAGAGGTVVTGPSSPIQLTGLTVGTLYDVYVRQVCAGPDYSGNTTLKQFATLCTSTTVPYLENFDGVTAPAIPTCVQVQNVNGGNTWTTVSTDLEVSSPNLLRLDYEVDEVTPADDWFYTRGLDLVGGTSYRLKFMLRNSDATDFIERLEVKYGASPEAGSMTLGTLFSNTNIDFNTWTEEIVDFIPASTGTYYIGFHGFSTANQAFLCIDDVSVDATPACAAPTGISVGSITGTTASVSFTSGGSNFIIEYGLAGFTPGTAGTAGVGGTIVTDIASPTPLTGLTPGTIYNVYIRQVCAGPSYGANSTMVPFTTPIANDDAPGAIAITVDAPCTGNAYTNIGATQSGLEPFASCEGTAGFHTVWFSFVAPASGAVRVSNDFAASGLGDSRLAVFSTSDVNDYTKFTILGCDDDNGSTAGTKSIVYLADLNPGETYYVQVDGYSSSTTQGTFCVEVGALTSTMIAGAAACDASQGYFGLNTTYTGWVSLVNSAGNLIANVRQNAGTATSIDASVNVNGGPVRQDPTSLQRYLDRNYRISAAGATNADVQFFFLNSELGLLQSADPATTLSNLGVTRQTETVSGCNADFAAANGTSTYLKQNANGTSTDLSVKWIQVTTPGFSNFYLHTSKAPVTLKTFLQGAYSAVDLRHKNVTVAWRNVLQSSATSQPYNVAPFNYAGTESVPSSTFTSDNSLTTDITDWVLLELRSSAPPAAPIATRAAFVREDGAIVDLDGTSSVAFRGIANGTYFVTIRHRNHLGVRTAAVQLVDGALGSSPAPALYDYTTAQAQAFQDGAVLTNAAMAQNGSVFLMWAGNANGDNFVRATSQILPPIPSDPAHILGVILGGNPNATGGYTTGDINMDGSTRATSQILPPIPSDAAVILSIPLAGNANATRREHK